MSFFCCFGSTDPHSVLCFCINFQFIYLNQSESVWIHQKMNQWKGVRVRRCASSVNLQNILCFCKFHESIYLNPSEMRFDWKYLSECKGVSVLLWCAGSADPPSVLCFRRGLIRANGLSNSNLILPYEHTLYNIMIFKVLRKICRHIHIHVLSITMIL